MKKRWYYAVIALFALSTFVACEKEEDDVDPGPLPIVESAEISDDNTELTITFSEGVYKNADATGNLDADNFTVNIMNGTAQGNFAVTHTAGEAVVKIVFALEKPANGEESVEVSMKDVYDADGNKVADTEKATFTFADLHIIGEWYSSGDNVALLLTTYFNVDSIYAKFNMDNTYLVESYDPDGVKTTYEGTYGATKSDTDNIYTIILNQSAPSSVTSEGIFEIYTDTQGYDMQYEVVQMQPDIGNSAPTPEAGFGSSNGGALGAINIQKFIRM